MLFQGGTNGETVKAKGWGGVPMDTAAPRATTLSFRVTLRMGICIGVIVCEAHEPWEVEVELGVTEENDAADVVARQKFRTMCKTHRVFEMCWNIASSVQHIPKYMGIYKGKKSEQNS